MRTATASGRYPERESITSVRFKTLLSVLLLAMMVFAAGCGGGEEAQDGSAEEQATGGQTTEQTEDRTEDTKAGEETTGGGGSGREVTLSIEGEPGTGFSGTCSVGDEESEIVGQVPKSFGYDLGGQQLECEIRQEDAGSLEVLLTGPGDRIQQQINDPGGTINLAYSPEGGVSSSTSSSGGSAGSVNQVVSNSSGGSSSSSSVSSR